MVPSQNFVVFSEYMNFNIVGIDQIGLLKLTISRNIRPANIKNRYA